MASEVDIANLALGHLGDNATVASLDPPEGSAQAEHCARFYPIARDSLLEHPDTCWKFATKRTTLAELTNTSTTWAYAYAKPADCIRVLAILSPEATSDQSELGIAQPQNYTVELNDDGTEVILTDQGDAVVRYISRTTDTTKFSPLFVMALSHHLASMLAGPVLKGDVGAAEGKRQAALMGAYLTRAIVSDARQHAVTIEHRPEWMASRSLPSNWSR